MTRRARVALVVGCLAAGAAGLYALLVESIGVGSFDQLVLVESARPVVRVTYWCQTVDDAQRRRLESAPDPRPEPWRERAPVVEGRFTARVLFTSGGSLFGSRVSYVDHLVVVAEFADGSRACRVVELPDGRGREAALLRFP